MNVDALRTPTDGEQDTRVDALEAENRRLRQNLAQVYRNRYRRTAYGFVAVGIVAILGALAFPLVRDVMLALGGTGIFAGVVLYYLTPERFVSAAVGERIYEALADDQSSMLEELDLRGDPLYVPTAGPAGRTVRLFVPDHSDYELPNDEALGRTFVVTEHDRQRGVAFDPTGVGLVEELRSATPDGLDTELGTVANQLADGIVEVFDLASRATVDVDADGQHVSLLVEESAYGPVDRFNHPIASLFATGIASAIDQPVRMTVTEPSGERSGHLVTCHLDAA